MRRHLPWRRACGSRARSGGVFALSGVAGPSIFPNTAVGTRVDFKPSANVVRRLALLDACPSAAQKVGSGGSHYQRAQTATALPAAGETTVELTGPPS